jgi:putative hemolysin
MKRALAVALAIAIAATGCGGGDDDQDQGGIANPASVYCEEQGGRVDIRSNANGDQVGICVFPDGREVDEWAHYRGEAEPTAPEG